MIKIKKFEFNAFSENTYVVWDEKSNEAIIVDPGCFDKSEQMELEEFITKNNLTPKYLINTHCHIDHILGCKYVKDKYQIPFIVAEADIPLLNAASKQAAMFGIDKIETPEADEFLTEQKSFSIGNSKMNFLFVPGHSPGGYCILFRDENICLTGDVLFESSIGRTDLWSGNYRQLINAITEKLFSLPDEVIIYPGHGNHSTIGKEKNSNPFFN